MRSSPRSTGCIDAAAQHLGAERANRYLRKFYPWYVERLDGGKALQAALQTAPDLEVARALMHAETPADWPQPRVPVPSL